jgi:hypothetical protein
MTSQGMYGGSRRLRGSGLALAAAVTMAACLALVAGGAVAVSAAAAARTAAPRVSWGRAEGVPGMAALNAGGNAQVLAVSCWEPGDCAAGGSYTDASGHQQAFVVTEGGGLWGRAAEVPGTAALNADGTAQVTAMSCARRGGCTAGGYYLDRAGNQQVFTVSRAGGRWTKAAEIPGTGRLNVGGLATVMSVSCASAGNCAAGGYYESYAPGPGSPNGNSNQAWVAAERNGRWARAEEVPGIAPLNTSQYPNNWVRSVSCASPGNCTAGGFWSDYYANFYGFVVSLVNGRWHRLVQPRNGDVVKSVSCWHPGDCIAAGGTSVERQTNGRWGSADQFADVPGPIFALSCPSAGNCALGGVLGYYASDQFELPGGAFVLSQRHGRWGKVIGIGGPASGGETDFVSCASAGNCGAGGYYNSGFDNYGNPLSGAFVVGERNGRWAVSEQPPGLSQLNLGGNAAVNSLSCPSSSICATGGYYTDAAGHTQAWVAGAG